MNKNCIVGNWQGMLTVAYGRTCAYGRLPLEEILYKQVELIGREENLYENLIAKERSLQEKMLSININTKTFQINHSI
jgi:hypothetical protein